MTTPLPPGLYEQVITERLNSLLEQLPASFDIMREPLDEGDAHERLARHVYQVLRESLHALKGGEADKLHAQLSLCNNILDLIQRLASERSPQYEKIPAPEELRSIKKSPDDKRQTRPLIPLHASALLTNDGERLSVGASLRHELDSADRVDLICAFVNYSGVRILEREIKEVCKTGSFRLITTTYMGATQRRALDLLAEWGAQIKVTYELPPTNTKLHAKAWLFYRETGFHTAYIGSSNLSHSALIDGLEWNVRLSAVDASALLDKFQSTFERYWADRVFETYDPARDRDRLDRALHSSYTDHDDLLDFFLDLEPRPHQREILEALEVERERRNKWRNLVVAATGTGKTVVAALDYKRMRRQWPEATLLFVAHRKEILQQSLKTYRTALRDGAFGEIWVDGIKPTEYRHVFASIQSLNFFDLERLPADHYDIIVIDEFHHAEANSYQRLLDYVKPRLLLGLTATPERADGKDVRDLFGGESTVELRLWDALEQGLLCPFQYFGIADNTDLTGVEWQNGSYNIGELEAEYVSRGEGRAALVFEQVKKYVTDWHEMRALGFCVSIRHARFMAEQFTKFGVPCATIDKDTSSDARQKIVRDLREKRLKTVFAVDIFNEGVDLPEVDTVLFLRPTESATVYVQQLGRGLRLCENKPCLTVLDFIGLQHQKFRFDFRYRALTGFSRSQLQEQLEQGFPHLPAGCHIQLDKVAQKTVLDNLKSALPLKRSQMVRELRNLAERTRYTSLPLYLKETGLQPEDLYRRDRYYTQLKREAGVIREVGMPLETKLGGALERLLTVDDPERIRAYSELLRRETLPNIMWLPLREQRMLFMLTYALMRDHQLPEMAGALERFWREELIRAEIVELLAVLDERSETIPRPLNVLDLSDVPLNLHAAYSRDDIMAAFGRDNPAAMREGVFYSEEHKCDVFLVTLSKTEQDFSPTTRYQDYPISPELFHWESQSTTRADSKAGQRYINHERQGSHILLMVRESKRGENGRTPPYICLGPVRYIRHESERPMRITWQLDTPMPETLYQQFRAAAG